MKLEQRENHDLSVTWSVTFTPLEISEAPRDSFDFRFLTECKESEKISDALLALQFIARRAEEQPQAVKNKKL